MTLRDLFKVVDPYCYIYIAGSGFECRKVDALCGDIMKIPEIEILKFTADSDYSLYVETADDKTAALSLLTYMSVYSEMSFNTFLEIEEVIQENFGGIKNE